MYFHHEIVESHPALPHKVSTSVDRSDARLPPSGVGVDVVTEPVQEEVGVGSDSNWGINLLSKIYRDFSPGGVWPEVLGLPSARFRCGGSCTIFRELTRGS